MKNNKYYPYIQKICVNCRESAAKLLKMMQLNGDSFIQTRIVVAGLSLLISMMIWAFVAWDGNSEGTRNISVQVQYINLTRGYSAFTPVKTINLRLTGRINALSGIEESDINAVVDMGGLQVGKYSLPIKIDIPPSVRLRSWLPSVSEVEIYRHIDRTVPLTWKVNGEVPPGMVISKVELYPETVTVSGPENDVLDVPSVNAIIPSDKLLSKEDVNVHLEITDYESARRKRITISPVNAQAKIFLEEEMLIDKIPVKVSVVGQPADGYQIDSVRVIPDSVSVNGRSESIKKMQSIILPPVDITGLDQDLQLMIPLQPADMDPDVEITGPDRARVEITIRNKMTTKTYANLGIVVVGSPADKEWKISPAAATVTVEGTLSEVSALQNGVPPLTLYVDVSNVVSKQIALPVLVKNLKKDLSVSKIEPEQVTLTALD